MNEIIEPYQLTVFIEVGEHAMKAVSHAAHAESWQTDCVPGTIGRIIKDAVATALTNQTAGDFNLFQVARAIEVEVHNVDGLLTRANEMFPQSHEYSVQLKLEPYTVTVTAENVDDARDYVYNTWRDQVEVIGLELDQITHVEKVQE